MSSPAPPRPPEAVSTTIVAISTAAGVGSRAVIRISGPGACPLLRAHLAGPSTFDPLPFRHQGVSLDLGAPGPDLRARASFFRAPRSYTGEDLVELEVPGSPALLAGLLRRLLATSSVESHRIEPARPGEFTLRAFLNGKLDLDQAEAVGRLIHAGSEAEARAAHRQIGGALGERLRAVEEPILRALALVEVGLDFPDEEIPEIDPALLLEPLDRAESLLAEISEHSRLRLPDRGSIRIALVGKPNAGKSSLVNAVVERPAALVSPQAGTTRDPVRAWRRHGDSLLEWVDLAGLEEATWQLGRESTGDGELDSGALASREAIRRLGEKELESADLVVWVEDCASPEFTPARAAELEELERRFPGRCLRVLAQSDRLEARAREELSRLPEGVGPVSALTGEGLPALLDEVVRRHEQSYTEASAVPPEGGFLVSPLQQLQIRDSLEALRGARQGIGSGLGGELVAIDLREALHALAPLTGREVSERVLGTIFGQFCLGK